MTQPFSMSKAQYLGNTTDLRFADGIVFSAVSSFSPEIGHDAPHVHENPIISFILEGESYERINRATNQRRAGDIRFYGAGDLHQVKINKFPSRNINFELENEFLRRNDFSEGKINASIETNQFAKHLFLRIYREFLKNDNLTDASIQILLFDLIGAKNQNENRKKPQWVEKIYDLLNDRWNENLSLREMALAVNVHPVTISKYFTLYFACTLGEYLRRLRIEKSVSMIKNSALSLTEIASNCGFSDQSHFTRNFKNFTGFLPKDFKKF